MALAIVTQSYRKDMRECELLCESIGRFAPPHISHYIVVNDEDYDLFRSNPRLAGSHILRKGDILPRYLVRLPFKMLGHHFHVSPFTLPAREWIVQQICKLGIFDVLPADIDAVMHVDSECVFMRPFSEDDLSRRLPDGSREWMLYKHIWEDEPCHDQYMKIAHRLLPLPADKDIDRYVYMAQPTIMVRENADALLSQIASGSIFKSWKHRLCNIYRFSEFYLYGLYSEHVFGLKNHYLCDKRMLPVVHAGQFSTIGELAEGIKNKLHEYPYIGVCLQKGDRSAKAPFSFDTIRDTVTSLLSTTF